MRYLVIPKLKLLIGWNPKVACTTIFTIILKKLDIKIIGNVHLDMMTHLYNKNEKNGKYGIYKLDINNLKDFNLKDFKKIAIIRNPYNRLISGIRQRSTSLSKNGFGNYNITYFLININKVILRDGHFKTQTNNLLPFDFDFIFDINDMKKFCNLINYKYENIHYGNHSTKYINDKKINYYNYSIDDISNNYHEKWSKNIKSWFTKENITLINKIYAEDFSFAEKNGIKYEKIYK